MLKNVLSLLLSKFYSKQESELVGHQAMPGGDTVNLVSNGNVGPDWTFNAFSGFAATDGYLFFGATADNYSPTIDVFCGDLGATLAFPRDGARMYASLPLRKGSDWRVQGSSLRDVTITLVNTNGGVYQALNQLFLQGDVLCRLSHWYSSLRRSSWLTRSLGSATSLKLSYQGARKSPLPLILKTIQRRATELCVSILLTLRGQSSALLLIAGGSYFTARTKQELIKRSRFLSQRVKRSTLLSQRIKAPLVSSSFRPLVLNPAVGGASC